jgi:hypothetical protein
LTDELEGDRDGWMNTAVRAPNAPAQAGFFAEHSRERD